MNLTFCNATAEYEEIDEIPVFHGATFHRLGLYLSAGFGAFAVICSFYLIFMHATHYLKPWEQKHIIRILFMVPVYSVVSFLSYLFYLHAVYFDVIRDCYEAFAIASFFSLLCHYVAPDIRGQKEYFRSLKPRGWIWPLNWLQKCWGGPRGCVRTPRSGLTWFNIVWISVYQYCLVRVLTTIVALGSQLVGRYCLDSLSPAFAHIWVTVINGVCVTIAMFCLIQFYVQLRVDLAEHKPLLKVVAIKLVIFLSFWQTIIINLLTSSQVIQESPQIATPDVKIGVPSLLLCTEMAIFSVFHIWAYDWNPYLIKDSSIVANDGCPPEGHTYHGGPIGIRALIDAFNLFDIIKAIGRGFRWICVRRKDREQDKSYKSHLDSIPLDGRFAGSKSGLNKSGKYIPLLDHQNAQNVQYNSSLSKPHSEFSTVTEESRLEIGDHSTNLGILQKHEKPGQALVHDAFDTQDTSYHHAYEMGSYASSGPRNSERDASRTRDAEKL